LKGLGEMDFDRIARYHHGRRPSASLLQINVEQAALADEVCSILMGDDVELSAGTSFRPTLKTSVSSTSKRTDQ
jgi:DNA gyrase/topoisomerase IV subunit B